jgi:hypothetical protein
MSEILTQGTKELYGMFSLPIPSLNEDMEAVRIDASKYSDINQLIKFLKTGETPTELVAVESIPLKPNPVPKLITVVGG